MKITFGKLPLRENQKHIINDVVRILNIFLSNNGCKSLESNCVDGNLNIKWDCSNDDYTKAFGLLFLLFYKNPHAYIKHSSDGCKIIVENNDYVGLYNYINERMDVTIDI